MFLFHQTGRLQKENLETEYCSRDTSFPIENIQNHIGIVIDAQCGRCCPDEESMEHLFLKCIYAYVCWRGSHITNEILLDSTSSFEHKFQAVSDFYSNIYNKSFSYTIIDFFF